MPRINAPCYRCENHSRDCHSRCEKYKAYKDEMSEMNSTKIKSRNKDSDYFGYFQDRAKRYRKTASYKNKQKGT